MSAIYSKNSYMSDLVVVLFSNSDNNGPRFLSKLFPTFTIVLRSFFWNYVDLVSRFGLVFFFFMESINTIRTVFALASTSVVFDLFDTSNSTNFLIKEQLFNFSYELFYRLWGDIILLLRRWLASKVDTYKL